MGKRVIWIALCAMVGLALSAAGLSSARTGQNTNSNAGGQSNSNGGGSQGNTNNGGGRSGGRSGGALASQDRKFVTNAAMSDMAEIEMSRLALERAASDDIRQMAQRLIDDHTRTSQELMQLAQTKGVAAPAALDGKHRSMVERLRRLSGAEFDREYARTAGVRAHQDAVKLFREEATRGRDAELRAFAARTLPALEEHLRMARSAHAAHAGHSGRGNTNGNMNGNMNGNTNGNTNSGRNTNSRGGSMNGNTNTGSGNSNNSNNSNR